MLQFADGFDHYQSLTQKWDTLNTGGGAGGQPYIDLFGGRGSTGCLVAATLGGTNVSGYVSKSFPNLATMLCGFAIKITPNVDANDYVVMQWMDGATVQVDLRITISGHFYFTRNGSILGTQSPNGIGMNAWRYIEVKVTIDPSVGVAILNVDGVNTGWLNLTAQNTRGSANSFTGSIRLGQQIVGTSGANRSFAFDDFYLADTTGSFNNAFLGDLRVQGQMPTGNGTLSQYTQNEAAWVGNTVAHIGQTIKDSNSNIQVITAVTGNAKTAVGAPTWATTIGVTTTDNNVTWTCLGASSQWLDVSQKPPEGSPMRLPLLAYVVGQATWDSNNNLQLCTTAGTTNSTYTPSIVWNTTLGGTTSDGGVTWTNLGLGEDTYLSDATVGNKSRFTFPAIVGTAVQAVVLTMRARKDDAGTRSIRGTTLSGGTSGDSPSDLPMSQSYQMVQGILETDPNTSAAWAIAAVNAAEFGVKTTA